MVPPGPPPAPRGFRPLQPTAAWKQVILLLPGHQGVSGASRYVTVPASCRPPRGHCSILHHHKKKGKYTTIRCLKERDRESERASTGERQREKGRETQADPAERGARRGIQSHTSEIRSELRPGVQPPTDCTTQAPPKRCLERDRDHIHITCITEYCYNYSSFFIIVVYLLLCLIYKLHFIIGTSVQEKARCLQGLVSGIHRGRGTGPPRRRGSTACLRVNEI